MNLFWLEKYVILSKIVFWLAEYFEIGKLQFWLAEYVILGKNQFWLPEYLMLCRIASWLDSPGGTRLAWSWGIVAGIVYVHVLFVICSWQTRRRRRRRTDILKI